MVIINPTATGIIILDERPRIIISPLKQISLLIDLLASTMIKVESSIATRPGLRSSRWPVPKK